MNDTQLKLMAEQGVNHSQNDPLVIESQSSLFSSKDADPNLPQKPGHYKRQSDAALYSRLEMS